MHRIARSFGVPVLHVYMAEAHPDDAFPSPMQGPVALASELRRHRDLEERKAAAGRAQAFLTHKVGRPVVLVADGMGDALEEAYEARPFRMFILDVSRPDACVVAHKTGLAPFNMGAKFAELRAFLCLWRSRARSGAGRSA